MRVLDIAARALARTRSRLSPLRFSSTLRGDQQHLHDILDQAEDARSSPVETTPWQATGFRRNFASGMFIRPHYWTYQHRFQPKTVRTAPSLVAPGRKEAYQHDVLRELGIDPLWETSNSTLLATFVSDLGKIRPRTYTRLTTKTQRRLGKAIRRAKMMGVIPLFYNPRMMPKPGQLK
ncbi:hypothetical protein L210DRAFT_3520727 [Boletus edulis BED1]|uniref:Small ribosomal subunit protein bS18m n=1 Tax=Boletus edulis BED1 TaxID=1328754 RepID=A0AAD4GM01_BOLED|nr:hypothetical protein L210DRAFT_3520727 [Boletus edulis BED1]